MNNSEQFDTLIREYIKNDEKYELQIRSFKSFLERNGLIELAFSLRRHHVESFFLDSLDSKIGTESQVISHISALKALFNFLIQSHYDYDELLGYISTDAFRADMISRVDEIKNKKMLSIELLARVLCRIDDYIYYENQYKTNGHRKDQLYFEMMISRIYIKLSLIIPLKTSQMLSVCIGDIRKANVRTINYNGVIVKVPSGLRKEIIDTIDYAEKKYGRKYNSEEGLFTYLYGCIDKKIEPSTINQTLPRIYKALGIPEMLERSEGGKKSNFVYPAECYKITAISCLMESGANIVYLKKLTGLDTKTLLSEFDYEKVIDRKDSISASINSSIIQCDYYEYL